MSILGNVDTVDTTLAPAGTTQATAATLRAAYTKCPAFTAGAGYVLPASNPPDRLTVENGDTTDELLIYPPSGASINGGTANAAVSLPAQDVAMFQCLTPLVFSMVMGRLAGVPNAEMQSVDPSQKVTYYDDFLGDTLRDEQAVTEGSGTGNAVAISAGQGGRLSITTASDDGAITANASAWELGALDWRADQGGLAMEVRLQIDDISEAYVFVGFTDVLPSGTLEAPIFLNAAAIDSDAANACGVLYDVDGTTEQWAHGGVKANTDTTPAYSGSAPTEGAYETIRVEISAAGAVRGYIDGTAIGDAVADAVTITTPLCPVIVVANRSANAVVVLADYVWIQADR